MFITILTFFLVLSILVLIHEAGHFAAAKFFGIKVLEFGFGLPPRIFGVKHGETIYSINALPIGGFVKLYGEEEAATEDKSELVRAFYKRPHFQKFCVIIGGVVMNFLLSLIIISFIFTQGVYVPTENVKVERVAKNSPAEKAGLRKNDLVKKIGKYEIKSADDLIRAANKYKGQTVEILVELNNAEITYQLAPRVHPPKNEGAMGVVINNLELKRYNLIEAPYFGLIETIKMSGLMFKGLIEVLGRLLSFSGVPKEVAGPIGIARLVGEASQYGIMAVLQLMGILSLNLAVVNIFPFPALDGGRLMFVLAEWISRRKINPRFESIVNAVGMTLLIGLIVLITANDLMRK